MRPSVQLRSDVEALDLFERAWVQYQARKPDEAGMLLLADQLVEYPPELGNARTVMAAAAGPAAVAVQRTGTGLDLPGRGPVNPVSNWPLFDGALLNAGPNELLDFVASVKAAVASELKSAEERERGLTGLLAGFVRIPTDVREAAGLESRAGQAAATAIGVTAQILIALLTGLLVAFVAYKVGW